MEIDGGAAPQDGDGRRTRRRTDAGSSGPGLGTGDACDHDDDCCDVLQLRVSIESLFNDASLSDVAILIGNGDQRRSFLCHK
eukprot:6781643-Prymnesium_polylepis.2